MNKPASMLKPRSISSILSIAAIVALATFLFALSTSGQSSALASGYQNITAKALNGHECNASEWHFVITQVANIGSAPASIHVTWDNGAQEDVARSNFTGKTAHYLTTHNLDATVTSATTQIYNGWGGQFNLSHGPCGNPPPSATATPTIVPSPTASPEWGTW